MDYQIKLSFLDDTSKTIEIKDNNFSSADAIREALKYINTYEEEESILIGVNVIYIGREIGIKG